MIDLHTHTTASDGRSTPKQLVAQAAAVGITTLGVTDHDTMAAVDEVRREAAAVDMDVVAGAEITSISHGRDIHVLAYFPGPDCHIGELQTFMSGQRHRRLERARKIGARLAHLGAPIDLDELLASVSDGSGATVGRPQIAQALVRAGHVKDAGEAFDRYIGDACDAYVPHSGPSPEDVVALVAATGGITSLAHPFHLDDDTIIPALADAGMDAIEAYHSSHDEATTAHYVALARRLGLAITGGSDYHGEGARRAEFFGVTTLPVTEYEGFLERARGKRRTSARS